MFENGKEIKKKAKEVLKENYALNIAVWAAVWGIIAGLLTLSVFAPVLFLLTPCLALVLLLGPARISLDIWNGGNYGFFSLFPLIKKFFRNLAGQLWKFICVIFWGIVSFLPALIFLIFALNSESDIVREIPWNRFSSEVIAQYYDYLISLSGVFILFLLLVILGFATYLIKLFTFSMAEFLLIQSKKSSVTMILINSKKIIKNNLLNIIYFNLSFTGWWCLVLLTGGLLGILWVGPYYYLSLSKLYIELREQSLQSENCIASDLE